MSLPINATWGRSPPAALNVNAENGPEAKELVDLKQDESIKELRRRVVLDSGAIIMGGRLEHLGDDFWTVQEVLDEIKDENARLILSTLSVPLQVVDVDPEALSIISKFAKLTGDFNRLSATDLKVMALTYQLEKRFNGIEHLNKTPKPLRSNSRASSTAPPFADQIVSDEEVDEGPRSCPPNKPDDTEPADAATANEAEGDQSASDIDDGEFERLPLHDLRIDDGWTVAKPRRADDASSIRSTGGSSRSKAAPPPGWYEGDNDDAGWITPENHADLVPSGCAPREDPVNAPAAEAAAARVSCATTDFAMQNVLLQMGMRAVNQQGLLVKQVKQFALKCHACFKLCRDSTRLFCPSCGNATLMRVAMFSHDDGSVTYSKGIKNFSTRGTKYSLPMPVQGRAKDDLVLREDQLLLSRHRRGGGGGGGGARRGGGNPDDFQTFSAASRGHAALAPQEIIGLGFRRAPGGGGGGGR